MAIELTQHKTVGGYREYPNLQQIVGEIPWGQNLLIISKIKDFPAREYYPSILFYP
jgi:predicted nuclease of restriction endonuclease-like (RecB) superfamily